MLNFAIAAQQKGYFIAQLSKKYASPELRLDVCSYLIYLCASLKFVATSAQKQGYFVLSRTVFRSSAQKCGCFVLRGYILYPSRTKWGYFCSDILATETVSRKVPPGGRIARKGCCCPQGMLLPGRDVAVRTAGAEPPTTVYVGGGALKTITKNLIRQSFMLIWSL